MLPVLLLLVTLLGSSSADTSGNDVGAAALAEVYLSDEEFPGMHLLQRLDGGRRFLVYKRGRRLRPGEEPLEVDASAWSEWSQMRLELEAALEIPAREPLELDWTLFNEKGFELGNLDAVRTAGVVFLLEIGRWMWPAVRVGFEQAVEDLKKGKAVVLRTLSLRPVVFEVRDFLDASECEDIRRIGAEQGLVASEGTLQSHRLQQRVAHASYRTSRQAWLKNDLSPLIAELDERTARLTRVPASHNEAVQLLRYDEGQFYHSHMDWIELDLFPDQRDVWLSSHFGHQDRLATVFWYLNDIPEGGETVFPKHGQPICSPESRGGRQARFCEGAEDPVMHSCESGLKVPPRQGTVILWYNFLASGRGDRNALHGGCPVGKNLTKWSGNKWVRLKPDSPPASWIADHPALARHGWSGEQDCSVGFTNAAGWVVQLFWVGPDKVHRRLVSLQPDETVWQKSFIGHKFMLQDENHNSNIVVCRPPSSYFVLTLAFELEERSQHDDEL